MVRDVFDIGALRVNLKRKIKKVFYFFHFKMAEIKMYIFVNTDLKMSPGKVAAQVGHVVQYITEEIIRSGYERCKAPSPTGGGIRPTPEYYQRYMLWKKEFGGAKITLKATTADLLELKDRPEARYVIDEGRTQIPKDSLTVVAFFPKYTSDTALADTKKFSLY